ncbi:MAG: FctA domain-containing protein [Lachnospiraceae bacterium]
MKKNLRRKGKKIFTSLALVTMLGISTTSTAFAKDWTPAETPTAAISKVLETGKDVVLPAGMNFKFTINKVSLNDETTDPVKANMPNLTAPDIEITAADEVTMTNENFRKDVYAKDGDNILAGFTVNENTVTGIYKYEITETADTVTVGDATKEQVTYDTIKYAFRVYVNEDADGNKYISGTNTVIINKDGTEGTDKIDPTPGSSETIEGSPEKYSGMKFVNGYSIDKGVVDPGTDPDPENPNSYGLKVSKTVTGKVNDTTAFPFNFNVAKPTAVGHEDTTFTYYVFDGTTIGAEQTGTYGTSITQNLKHNQSIVLKNAYEGSMVAVTEKGVTNYIPSAAVTLNGTTTQVNAAMGKDLSIGDNKIMGAGANTIDYTNKFQDMTPTGIIMNNLPFFMLIIVAFLGIGAFAVINSRKKRSLNN